MVTNFIYFTLIYIWFQCLLLREMAANLANCYRPWTWKAARLNQFSVRSSFSFHLQHFCLLFVDCLMKQIRQLQNNQRTMKRKYRKYTNQIYLRTPTRSVQFNHCIWMVAILHCKRRMQNETKIPTNNGKSHARKKQIIKPSNLLNYGYKINRKQKKNCTKG